MEINEFHWHQLLRHPPEDRFSGVQFAEVLATGGVTAAHRTSLRTRFYIAVFMLVLLVMGAAAGIYGSSCRESV